MASFNKVIMMGNLTRDPEYKQFSGSAVCRLNIATNRQFKNKQTGNMTQEVCYIEVDVWGNQAESCNQYLQKGRPVLVEGRLKLDTWEQDGQTRRKHLIVADRVVFLGNQQSSESYGEESYSSPAQNNSNSSNNQSNSSQSFTSNEIDFKDEAPFDDELPF